MEADQGDLADIVRATGQASASPTAATPSSNKNNNFAIHDNWSYDPSYSDDQGTKFSTAGMYETCDEFGDPFTDMKDPLMQELDQLPGAVFFDEHDTRSITSTTSSGFMGQTCLGSDHEQQRGLKRPTSSNIFSRMLQISPSVKSSVSMNPSATSLVANDVINQAGPAGISAADHNGNIQIISSSRNNGSSIKRRKSQAKKVVCVPAPAAANSRASGEVVPSDLWAWRKYGQKPIKGSPYPRGYYRCSSSKGCSARKQVERSRTDPNMLVITYTSEHNHPWPTQRNALAGSTRSQPLKGNAPNSSKGSPSCSNTTQVGKQNPNNHALKKEPKESHSISTSSKAKEPSTVKDRLVKKEMDASDLTNDGQIKAQFLDNMMEEEDFGQKNINHNAHKLLSLPMPMDHHPISQQQHDDFFADLGEIEPDPLNLMQFCGQEFPGEKHGGAEKENKLAAMDPFSNFDWSDNSFGDS